ncbi:MAG: hypothetical protein J6A01_13070 [Proteobacteria bacterium]|nr:hypothetical protein [Pseudomonadota bacterium]
MKIKFVLPGLMALALSGVGMGEAFASCDNLEKNTEWNTQLSILSDAYKVCAQMCNSDKDVNECKIKFQTKNITNAIVLMARMKYPNANQIAPACLMNAILSLNSNQINIFC